MTPIKLNPVREMVRGVLISLVLVPFWIIMSPEGLAWWQALIAWLSLWTWAGLVTQDTIRTMIVDRFNDFVERHNKATKEAAQ